MADADPRPRSDAGGSAPNVIVILADDLGYSDLGCFGGEIRTPTLDRLGSRGIRMTSFYNTARCSPSRASLLTGRHPHQTGIGILTDDDRPHGYPGSLRTDVPTIAELFKAGGYATALAGKWHLSHDVSTPSDTWPTRRGFDDFFGILAGADSYFNPRGLHHNEQRLEVTDPDFYLTDAISDHAAEFVTRSRAEQTPFFLYLAYTAPHWPLHAPEADIAAYQEIYQAGWDILRRNRLEQLIQQGLLPADTALSTRDPSQPRWDDITERDWHARRMAVYAAQVERMDTGIAGVLNALGEDMDNTLILFLSDNGASAETMPPPGATNFASRQPDRTRAGESITVGNTTKIIPGSEATYASYGTAWANLSNTPFRLYKEWVHEGGISTPLIASWPAGLGNTPRILDQPFQLTDILPTLVAAAGLGTDGRTADRGAGRSMLPTWRTGAAEEDIPLFWEHLGNCAVRLGRWKLIRTGYADWSLYDLRADRAEEHDRAPEEPQRVAEMAALWQDWADANGVIPWAQIEPHLAYTPTLESVPEPATPATNTPCVRPDRVGQRSNEEVV